CSNRAATRQNLWPPRKGAAPPESNAQDRPEHSRALAPAPKPGSPGWPALARLLQNASLSASLGTWRRRQTRPHRMILFEVRGNPRPPPAVLALPVQLRLNHIHLLFRFRIGRLKFERYPIIKIRLSQHIQLGVRIAKLARNRRAPRSIQRGGLPAPPP